MAKAKAKAKAKPKAASLKRKSAPAKGGATPPAGKTAAFGGITKHGKRMIASAMYHKGKAFFGAAFLLWREGDRQGGTPEHVDYVALNNLCQGIEVLLKGLLLLKDYDKFKPLLAKKYHHHLTKTANATITAYALRPLRPKRRHLADELAQLSKFYSQHLLRYGTHVDIFIDPRTIARDRVFRAMHAVTRLAEREFKNLPAP